MLECIHKPLTSVLLCVVVESRKRDGKSFNCSFSVYKRFPLDTWISLLMRSARGAYNGLFPDKRLLALVIPLCLKSLLEVVVERFECSWFDSKASMPQSCPIIVPTVMRRGMLN